jgi:hypothetical protein
MPASFPGITNVALGHCFDPEILGLGNLFPVFFQSLKVPLRSLALLCIPGLTESHVATVLSAVGNNLKRLEIDGVRSSSNDAPLSVSREMFNALVTNCKRLEYLSLCGVKIFDLIFHPLRLLSSIAGLKELVSKRNTHHAYTRIDEGYQEVSASQADMQYGFMFLKYGTQLETFRGDFSDIGTASIALGSLINLQLQALSDAGDAANANGVPNRIKLQKVDMGKLHPDTIARAIQAGVREFEMIEISQTEAMNSFLNIRSCLMRRGGFTFPHEVVFRFSSMGECICSKPYVHAGVVDSSAVPFEFVAIESDGETPDSLA